MKLLITGGCGFVGTNLADALLARGMDVVIIDNLSRIGSRDNLDWLIQRHGQSWRFIEADIRDADEVARLIEEIKPHALAHLAGQVAMTTSIKNPRIDFEVNTVGSLNILEAVRLFSPETIVIYSSTNKVYGDLEWVKYEETETRYVTPDFPSGFNESTPLDFRSPYGCSKGAADQYMLDYARIFGLKTVVFRHSSMYGGRQFATYDQGWIGWFCQKAIETKRGMLKKPFTISGTGKQVRDVLHAEDLITLYFSAIEHIEVARGQAFNIGGGLNNSLSLLELFELIEELTGTSLNYIHLPFRESDQRVFVANISKAREIFEWTPKIGMRNGIGNMLAWVKGLDETRA